MSSAPLNQQQFDPGITQSYTGDLRRIVNRDGSFNVRRKGWSLKDLHVYQLLLSLSWPAFMGLVLALFIFINGIFAGLYAATGLGNLAGAEAPTRIETLLNAFFFSVQTLTTVGYGTISPKGIATNAIASVEAMMGVMGFAFAAGLLYGRFSRPSARILFSDRAVIAPFRDGTSLQFRIANRRSNAIVNLEATVLLMTVEWVGGAAQAQVHEAGAGAAHGVLPSPDLDHCPSHRRLESPEGALPGAACRKVGRAPGSHHRLR